MERNWPEMIQGYRMTAALLIAEDLAVFEQDIARVPTIRVCVHCHQCWSAGVSKSMQHRSEGSSQIAVSILHPRAGPQQRQCLSDRPASAERLGAVMRITNPAPELPAITDESFDLLTVMAAADDDFANPLSGEKPQLVRDERLACNVPQRFRHARR